MIIPDIVLAIALLSFFTRSSSPSACTRSSSPTSSSTSPIVCLGRAHPPQEFRLLAGRGVGRSRRGASSTTFLRVTLPVILPGSSPAALLAFTLSVDEFIIAYFTAGAGRASTTLPMQIYAMIRFGVTPEINALATL